MLFEVEGLVGFLVLAFWLYCLFDVISAEPELVRNLPKGVWIVLVIVLSDVGGLAWLVLGRPLNTGWVPGQPQYRPPPARGTRPGPVRRPLGPEDSPEFDERIDRSRQRELSAREADLARRERADRARRLEDWEQELQRREADLRRREDGGTTPPPA